MTYPMLDHRTGTSFDRGPHAGEFVWTAAHNRFAWGAYLSGVSDPVPGYASSARAKGLAELPSTFISVGALDLFVDESVEFARGLIRDGVPVELHVYPGAFHSFSSFPSSAAVVERARHDSLDALRRA